MPNHVKTVIKFIGENKEEVSKNFFEKCVKTEGDETSLDFNEIIPMPDYIFTGNLGTKEREMYGKNNWYDWSIRNWGTKWNAYEFNKIDDYSFEFQTAWNHPEPIIYEIFNQYKCEMEVEYADEDMGYNCASYTIDKTGIIERELENAYEFACELWGWYPEEDEDDDSE